MSFVSTPKEVNFQNVSVLAIVDFSLLYCSVDLFDILKNTNSAQILPFFFSSFFSKTHCFTGDIFLELLFHL